MQRTNGSRVVSATPMLVQLSTGAPNVPPLQIQVWPDWQGAPNEGAALTSVLVLALIAGHQTIATLANRVAALEVATTERERLREGAPDLPSLERSRAHQRLALTAIASVADQIEIGTSSVAPADDVVGAPASALDLLGIEDGPAPDGSARPTDDSAD